MGAGLPRRMEGDAPLTIEQCLLAIQQHREAIVKAQQAVLRRELTMPQYNDVYKQHVEEIHKYERLLMELQAGGGAAGGGPMY
jgi:hypothetical protein